jgi:hypothetical protein
MMFSKVLTFAVASCLLSPLCLKAESVVIPDTGEILRQQQSNPSVMVDVQLKSDPAGSASGVIDVVVPKALAGSNGTFTFLLPEKVRTDLSSSSGAEKVTLLGGSSLPDCLQYDSQDQTFKFTKIPDGTLPLTVVITSGSQSWNVVIKE